MRKSDRLALLGLARRAGKLVIGAEESRRAIRRGIARVVVLAADASDGQRGKVEGLSQAMDVPVVQVTGRAALGKAVGQGLVTAVVVTDKGLGAQVLAAKDPGARKTQQEGIGTKPRGTR